MASVRTWQQEFASCAPELAKLFLSEEPSIDLLNDEEVSKLFEQSPSISVDYAVMGNSDRVTVLPLKWDGAILEVGRLSTKFLKKMRTECPPWKRHFPPDNQFFNLQHKKTGHKYWSRGLGHRRNR